MARYFWITLVIAAIVVAAGCNREATASAGSSAAAPPAAPAVPAGTAGSMPLDGATAVATQASLAATSAEPGAVPGASDFDPASVPITTASLPPFPFFKAPEGLQSGLDEKDKHVSFDGQYFIAGNKPVMVEG